MKSARFQFESELLGVGRDGELGGRISAQISAGRFASQRTDVDEVGVRLEEVWGGRGGAADGCEQIYIQQTLEIFGRGVERRTAHREAGVVDEDIQSTELVHSLGEEVFDSGLLCDVGDD